MRSNFTVEETSEILMAHYPWALRYDSHVDLWRIDRLMREFMVRK